MTSRDQGHARVGSFGAPSTVSRGTVWTRPPLLHMKQSGSSAGCLRKDLSGELVSVTCDRDRMTALKRASLSRDQS